MKRVSRDQEARKLVSALGLKGGETSKNRFILQRFGEVFGKLTPEEQKGLLRLLLREVLT